MKPFWQTVLANALAHFLALLLFGVTVGLLVWWKLNTPLGPHMPPFGLAPDYSDYWGRVWNQVQLMVYIGGGVIVTELGVIIALLAKRGGG